MTINIKYTLLVIGALSTLPQNVHTADINLQKEATLKVYFSPKGGCTDAITKEIDQAKTEIFIQAYSFTSAPVAKALVNAHKRYVKVHAILGKSQ